jgi:hypothetical protein
MLTAETNSSQKFHTTKTSEFIASLMEMTPKPDESDLRGQFLHAHKNGERLTLPENTVAIESSSHMVLNDAFSTELLGKVTNIMQKYPDSFSTIGNDTDPFHFTRLEESKKLTDLRSEMEEKNDTLQDGEFKLTLLYSEQQEDDSQESPLSAVLVFGEPTPEQIEALRDKLPSDVPLLDGTTNELLDTVGTIERHEAERAQRLQLFLAALALRAYANELRAASATAASYRTTSETANTTYSQPENFDAAYDYFDGMSWKTFKEDYDTTKHTWEQSEQEDRDRADAYYRSQYERAGHSQSPKEEPAAETYVPKTEKENLEHQATRLLNEEAKKFGVTSWLKLDQNDLSRVQGRIARQLRPDLDDSNPELFKKVSDLIARRKGSQPYRDNPEEKPPTSSQEYSEPPQAAEQTSEPTTEAEDVSPEPTEETDVLAQSLALNAAPPRQAIASTPHNSQQ